MKIAAERKAKAGININFNVYTNIINVTTKRQIVDIHNRECSM